MGSSQRCSEIPTLSLPKGRDLYRLQKSCPHRVIAVIGIPQCVRDFKNPPLMDCP